MKQSTKVALRRKALVELVDSIESLLTQYSDRGLYEPDPKTSRVERAIANANNLIRKRVPK